MIGTIRKHQKWLWIFIATITIVTFLAWTDASGRLGFSIGKSRREYRSPVDGKPVSLYGTPITEEEFFKAYHETRINYFLRSGGRQWPGTDEATQHNLERDTLYRLLLIRKLKDLDVHVSERAVARAARERIGEVPYATFVKEFLEVRDGASSADFERFAMHEAGIQQLLGAAAVESNLVNPREAERLYRRDHEEVATDLAVFWATNFMDQVAVTPEALSQFYTNRMAVYRVPARIQLSYVEFPATNFLAEADKQLALEFTNLNNTIDDYFIKQGGTNAFKHTNGLPKTEAEAKAEIKEKLRENRGLREARKKASEFGTDLGNQPQLNRADTLDKLAAAKGFPVKVSPPFDRYRGLEDSGLPNEFYKEGFALTTNAPVKINPVVGDKGVFIIALKTNLPSEMPSLDKIRDKVTLDFKHDKALELARASGTNFHRVLTNGLAQKKTFTELCVESKVKTIPVPPFSASTRSLTNLDERVSLQMLQAHAFDLKSGQASEFLPGMEGGMILYLRQRLPFDEKKVQADLPEFISTLRNARLNDAFNSWFRKQAEQAQLRLPQKETQTGMPGAPN